VGSLALIPVVGSSLFPKSDKPMFLVQIDTPLGTSLRTTNEVTRFVERELANQPDVVSYATNVGKGNPRIYYTSAPTTNHPTTANCSCRRSPRCT